MSKVSATSSVWCKAASRVIYKAAHRVNRERDLQIAIVHPDAQEFADQLASEAPSPIEYAADVPDEVLAEDLEIVPYRIGIERDRMRTLPVEAIFQ